MNKQSGSAIFVILIAVALFAALGYAFMQGNRGSTTMMTGEAAKAYASQIIAYGNDIKTAVKRMKLRGVQDTGFGFDNTIFLRKDGTDINGPGHNANCTTDSCKVFGTGGGVVARPVTQQALDYTNYAGASASWAQPGHLYIFESSFEGVGTNKGEIAIIVPFLQKDVCLKINEQLGISNPDGNPPERDAGSTTDVYSGSFTDSYTYKAVPSLSGKKEFCLKQDISYSYHSVILER